MNPRELVDHIRSGPVELVLDEPLRFRRRSRSNPCDFNEFLQALQSSETIRYVQCTSQQTMGIAEDEWFLLAMTMGRIKDIQHLFFDCTPGSRDFHPFQAVAEALNNAQSLREILIDVGGETPIDSSGLAALANALREHTALEKFTWFDWSPLPPRDLSLDPVIRALPGCPHLREVSISTEYASCDASGRSQSVPNTLVATP
jgi:hypothetical protein